MKMSPSAGTIGLSADAIGGGHRRDGAHKICQVRRMLYAPMRAE
jgi:hypothetical protein